MSQTPSQAPNPRFTGRWIGETQGCAMPAHIWEITQHTPNVLAIATRWENHPQVVTFMGFLLPDEDAFAMEPSPIPGGAPKWKAVLTDPQHFIIPGWDTNDVRNNEGPDYDVVFSRPGLAELAAHEVWLKYKESIK